ncbi:BrnT family toxin [uncultured Sphaerochaeta sp.]|uniref:BrnT family toxin n=1 Tax=uncultured Sphaerochaeta sp. TaxID=886478 RepID=UPI002A0A92BA|nr:BrnT family toxin [uncultured Sphaerochaeta sp.]
MSFQLYTWDPEKSKKNKKKHGFSFEDIADVFDDPNLLKWGHQNHISEGGLSQGKEGVL